MAPPKVHSTASRTVPTPSNVINGACLLLDTLPPELRNHIYSFVIASNKPKPIAYLPVEFVYVPFSEDMPALFHTCKQIHAESRRLFLYEHTFHLMVSPQNALSWRQESWLLNFASERVARFMAIEVSYDPETIFRGPSGQSLGNGFIMRLCQGNLGAHDYHTFFRLDHRVDDIKKTLVRQYGPKETAARQVVRGLVDAGFELDQIKIVRPLPSKHDMVEIFAEAVFEVWKATMKAAIDQLR